MANNALETMLEHPLNLSQEAVSGGPLASVASKSAWPVQDTMHALHSAEAVRTGASAHHHFTNITGMVASNLGGFLSIAAGTGISAYINHLVHGHQQKNLLKTYRTQIAGVLGKSPDETDMEDLRIVAESNPSLKEELDRNTAIRNLSTASTLIGSTVAFAAVLLAVSLFPPLAALGAAAAASGLVSGAGLAFVAASTAVSFVALTVAGKGLFKLGKKVFGHDRPTTEDHVDALDALFRKGEHVSPEQVMGVYVSATPELAQDIKKTFGKPYDELTAEQQVRAEAMFGGHIPLESLAAEINRGQLNPRDLLFIVHGQSTGADNGGSLQEHVMNENTASEMAPQPAPQPAVDAVEQAAVQWRARVEQQRNEAQQPQQPAR